MSGAMALHAMPKSVLDLDVLVGGMGVDISSVELVSTVARHVSGRLSGSLSATGLTDVYARLLQLGDVGDVVRRAFDAFQEKVPALADDVERLYLRYREAGGTALGGRLKGFSLAGPTPPRDVQIFTVLATFSHVWRTKLVAPDRPVGINFLRKVDRVLLYGLYGAMLAGVDWVVMGAGDPGEIPAILDDLARNDAAELPIHVATLPRGGHRIRFDPRELVGADLPPPPRPTFLAIVSSHLQAEALASHPVTRPEGFVVESPVAGGHNAPPRNRVKDDQGNYVYGPEDEADLDAMAALGLPFWVAGGRGHPPDPAASSGVGMRRQVGTLFALCNESGMEPELRRRVLRLVWERKLDVVASANASPSGFPFRVARVPGTMGDPATYAARPRGCDLGYLRGWRPRDGRIVGLCPADDPGLFQKMGGAAWRTEGSMCLCNSLLATCGLGQRGEPALVTLGDTTPVRALQLRLRRLEYSADEAIAYLLGEL
jgi:NAD(P)H-dependent flavin oxidoreductase YrpB (nitropropane dioxygenase family)